MACLTYPEAAVRSFARSPFGKNFSSFQKNSIHFTSRRVMRMKPVLHIQSPFHHAEALDYIKSTHSKPINDAYLPLHTHFTSPQTTLPHQSLANSYASLHQISRPSNRTGPSHFTRPDKKLYLKPRLTSTRLGPLNARLFNMSTDCISSSNSYSEVSGSNSRGVQTDGRHFSRCHVERDGRRTTSQAGPRRHITTGNASMVKGVFKVEGTANKPSSEREVWQTQKDALERKFGETGWAPRKRLSPDAIEGIRAIHIEDPEQYTTEVLAENFKVSPEAIRRILKSKWRPSEEEEADRRQRWKKRGEKIWGQMVELGVKPPKKWREMGTHRSVLFRTKRQDGISDLYGEVGLGTHRSVSAQTKHREESSPFRRENGFLVEIDMAQEATSSSRKYPELSLADRII